MSRKEIEIAEGDDTHVRFIVGEFWFDVYVHANRCLNVQAESQLQIEPMYGNMVAIREYKES